MRAQLSSGTSCQGFGLKFVFFYLWCLKQRRLAIPLGDGAQLIRCHRQTWPAGYEVISQNFNLKFPYPLYKKIIYNQIQADISDMFVRTQWNYISTVWAEHSVVFIHTGHESHESSKIDKILMLGFGWIRGEL